jgi:ubiquinone/menaquinone biosynthesis C-methylase UbiE
MGEPRTIPSPASIMSLANAFYSSSVLFAASDAGLFSALDKVSEGLDAVALAAACGLDERAGRLLVDAAVASGLLIRSEKGLYTNTPESATYLVDGKPGSLCEAIRYNRDVYDAWGKLPAFLTSGAPVEKPALHLGEDPERTRTFVHSMHGRALGIGQAVIPQLDLSGCQRLLDAGGGPGTYSVLAARANPELECCTVLDLPEVVAVAEELIAEAGMSERVQTLPGSYHEVEFPGEQDVVQFFGCLHQESPAAIQSLFRKAFAALRPGGRIYVMDLMTDATRTAPAFSALFALNMALTTDNGWVFSDADMEQWLGEAGFETVSVAPLPPPMPHWLAVAFKPQ